MTRIRWARPLLLAAVGVVTGFGTFWAFQRGGNDFAVFHEAWRLAFIGQGTEIYHAAPDRFLYAPGFAWILAPFGLIPKTVALALWSVAKAAVLFALVFALGKRLGRFGVEAAAAAALFVARPILIDFQYGQVNLFILAACVWALLEHCDSSTTRLRVFGSWFVLSLAAVTKVYPGILVLLPLIAFVRGERERAPWQMGAMIAGGALMVILPALSLGIGGAWALHLDWIVALQGRGLPLESHNQSFLAFLHHLFSGTPTPVMALYGIRDFSVGWVFSPGAIRFLGFSWLFVTIALTLGWMVRGSRSNPLAWSAVLIGLLIIPSHLVWKPYFVFALPAVACLIARLTGGLIGSARTLVGWGALVLAFVLLNFTGFDFIGYDLALWCEASALLLWIHLALLGATARLDA